MKSKSLLPGHGAVLIRVSTDKQDVSRQRGQIAEWLRHRGYDIPEGEDFVEALKRLGVGLYEDAGRRDLYETRPEFRRLLEDASASKVQWAVVERLKRLGYNDEVELNHFIYLFRKGGCRLWDASEDRCFSERGEINSFKNVVEGLASPKDQRDLSNNVIGAKVVRAATGEYQGSKGIPYGLDVVCRRGGVDLWRYVQMSKWRGLKITPDGRTEETTGIPPHVKRDGERVYYDRTVMEDRIKVVQSIYSWYTSEAIGFQKIANRLNDMKVDPCYEQQWYGIRVRDILDKPLYIGLPSQFRSTQSRIHDRVRDDSGAVRLVERDREIGAIRKATKNPRDMWVMPDKPLFTPLVDPEVYRKAQEKRKGTPERQTRKSDVLWLVGLVTCARCGKPMVSGRRPLSKRVEGKTVVTGHTPAYRCQTTAKVGHKRNVHGCKSHTVPHEVVEGFVNRYLECYGHNLQHLMTLGDPAQSEALSEQLVQKGSAFEEMYARIVRFLLTHLGEGRHRVETGEGEWAEVVLKDYGSPLAVEAYVISGTSEGWQAVEQLYRRVFLQKGEQLRVEIAELEAEEERLYERLKGLQSPRLVERAQADLNALGEQVEALRAQLDPLDAQVIDLRAELAALAERYGEARIAMVKGSNRHKAESVRKVIRSIDLEFTTGAYHSKLARVTILPLVGERVSYDLRPGSTRSRTR